MRILRFSIALAVVALLTPQPARAQDATSPEKALEGFKAALEEGSLKKLGDHMAGEEGASLRKLAVPFEKARTAGDRFEKALKDAKIDFKNPFTSSFNPIADVQFDVINNEIVRKNDREHHARIKYGPRGKAQEETVVVVYEGNTWRVGAPNELAKTIPGKNRLENQTKGLEKLAEILDKLTADIEGKKLKSKDQVGVQLILMVEKENLAELLQ